MSRTGTYLTESLAGSAGYIGLLGAMHRSSLLLSEAAAHLGRSVAECCERVWAPVGLDLGGDGAEAIALAVVAEVQAWRQGKLGVSRKLYGGRCGATYRAGRGIALSAGAMRDGRSEVKTAAVVLAAGASVRLGEPKQLVRLAGETLLERTIGTAREAGCSPVVVVLGASYVEILAHSQLGDAIPVINDKWKQGMASSIRLGVRALGFVAKEVDGVVLMTCDQPAATAGHLRALMMTGEAQLQRMPGGEAFRRTFRRQHSRTVDEAAWRHRARELLRDAEAVALRGGELDIDTAEDLSEVRRRYS